LQNSRTGSEVEVATGDKSWICPLPETVINSSENGFEEDLKWLVERHAVRDPFEGTAALRVMKNLRKYGTELLDALQLHNGFPTRKPTLSRVLVEVHDDPAASTRLRGVHWEVLEDPRLYVRSKLMSDVSVRRIIVSPKFIHQGSKHAISDSNTAHTQILAVTARKPGFDPIPHRLVTKPMLRIMKGLGMREELRILRPPTFQQLEKLLQQSDFGTYQIVHLDLHGSVDDTG
jgi:hypothetical protein